MSKLTVLSLAAAASLTASADSTGVDVSDFAGNVKLMLDASAMTGTTPTMDVKIQHSRDNGSTDAYADAGVAFTQVTTAASFQEIDMSVDGFKKFIRVVSTLSGTTPAGARSVTLVGNKAL